MKACDETNNYKFTCRGLQINNETFSIALRQAFFKNRAQQTTTTLTIISFVRKILK